jgi:hypothetical protein
LPADGRWRIDPPDPGGGLSEVFLAPAPGAAQGVQGERHVRLENRRTVDQARQQLNMLYWACRQHASRHDGVGPDGFGDLDLEHLSWFDGQDFRLRFKILPGVRLEDEWGIPQRVPLVVEVRPAIDDGGHWVLWANQEIQRVPIDPEFLARHGIEVTPESAVDQRRGLDRDGCGSSS